MNTVPTTQQGPPALRTKTWAGVAPLPTLPRPGEVLRAPVVTEWGVRHQYRNDPGHVEEFGGEAAARRWLAKLLFCGNLDAVLVARAAGVGAAWLSMGGSVPHRPNGALRETSPARVGGGQ